MSIKLKFFEQGETVLPLEEYRGIPSIEYAGNGQLWIVWYGGGDGEKPGNYISYSRSFDYGSTWTDPAPAVVPEDLEKHRAFDPCLWRSPDNRLWFFWSTASGKTDKVMLWCSWTPCSELKWTEPVMMAPGIMMNKPVALSNGEWILPVAYWTSIGEHSGMGSARVYASRDCGESFEYRGSAVIPDSDCDEHIIMETAQGRLQMFARTCNGIAESYSEDWGRSWSPGQLSVLYGVGSRFFIGRLASGRMLLINHAPTGASKQGKNPRRTNLTAYLSEDSGKTWPYAMRLDSRPDISYPDCAQDEHGRIYITYDRERFDARKIVFRNFTEADIIEQRVTSYIELGMQCDATV